MPDGVIAQIRELQQMTVGQLRAEWQRLYGEPARSRNRQFLWRRLSWRLQELALGGVSERAQARAAELALDAPLRIRPPRGFDPAAFAAPPRPKRDPRLPKPGAQLIRSYRGQEIHVRVLDDGFEYDGRPYPSLSAVAHAITGQHWNGRLFFGLTERRRT